MTVYASADSADVFASHKVRETVAPTARLTRLSELPLIDRQCFTLLDDLQQICHNGVSLSNADIGAIQAKLIILRVNLNIRHNVNTPHLGQSDCV